MNLSDLDVQSLLAMYQMQQKNERELNALIKNSSGEKKKELKESRRKVRKEIRNLKKELRQQKRKEEMIAAGIDLDKIEKVFNSSFFQVLFWAIRLVINIVKTAKNPNVMSDVNDPTFVFDFGKDFGETATAIAGLDKNQDKVIQPEEWLALLFKVVQESAENFSAFDDLFQKLKDDPDAKLDLVEGFKDGFQIEVDRELELLIEDFLSLGIRVFMYVQAKGSQPDESA